VNAGGAGSQTLAQTLVLGNTTGGEDIVFSAGDAADFTNTSPTGIMISLPDSKNFRYISSGNFSWTATSMVWLNGAGTQYFDVNEDGSVTIGAGAIDGSLIFSRDTFDWDIDFETITGARTETKPDADIDWTGATDKQVMGYNSSTNTYGPALEIEANSFSNTSVVTLDDSSGLTPDLEDSNFFTYTLTGNETLNFPIRLRVCNFQIKFIQDGTGSRTLSFDSAYLFAGGTAPTLSTAANSEDIITGFCDGTNVYIVASLDFQTA
jgi:hypothetical protein